LAEYLSRAGGEPAVVVAHRLAAVLLQRITGSQTNLAIALDDLAAELRTHPDIEPPTDPNMLTAAVAEVPGARLETVLADLVPDPRARAALLNEVVTTAVRAAARQE
jgi:hypothetical protein